MAYTRATVIDPSQYGDTVKEAVLKNDTDLKNIFTHLNTHEGKVSTHGVVGDLVGTTDVQSLTNKSIPQIEGTVIIQDGDLIIRNDNEPWIHLEDTEDSVSMWVQATSGWGTIGTSTAHDLLLYAHNYIALRFTDLGVLDVTPSLSVLDEDDMDSDSAVHFATQQSIKAYSDGYLAAMTLPVPDSDDDGKLLEYDHVGGQFVFVLAGGGGAADTITIDDALFDKFLAPIDEGIDFLQDVLDFVDEYATEVVQSDSEPGTTYPGMVWVDTDADAAVHGTLIQDTDGDTKIQCEESADEDMIRFDCDGVEHAYLQAGSNQVLTVTGRESPNIHVKSTVDTSGGAFKISDATGDLHGFGAYGRDHALFPSEGYIYCWKSGRFIQQWTEDGEVTKPQQPQFRVDMLSGLSNISIGSYHQLPFDGENFDVGSNFNTGTYTFTAPVSGYYFFQAQCYIQDWASDATYYILRILAGGTDIRNIKPGVTFPDNTDVINLYVASSAWMDANDTAVVQFYQAGGTVQTDVSVTGNYGFFAGHLMS